MAFTFPTSPSAGDTFQHGGLEFVYRASPSRWAVNGYNGIPDPFADFNATDFVFRDAMANYADVVFSSPTWPFRTQSFSFIENPQTFAESMEAFPNQDTQGLWYSYVNTGTSNVGNIIPGTGSIGAFAGTALTDILSPLNATGNLSTAAAYDVDGNRVDNNTGSAPDFQRDLGRSSTQDNSDRDSFGVGIGEGPANARSGTRPSSTATWTEVTQLVSSLATASDGMPVSVHLRRGNTIVGTDAAGGNYYNCYWRTTRTNLIADGLDI